jgi:hypothetical protein
MGIIRKTLMVSTAGIVRGSSKKQRVAKAGLRQQKLQTSLLKDVAAKHPTHALTAGWHPSPFGETGVLRFYDGRGWDQSRHAVIMPPQ